MWYNIKLLTKDYPTLIVWMLITWFIIVIGHIYVDIPSILWNQWMTYVVVERVSHVILSILIGLFVATHVYRFRKLRTLWWKKTLWWSIGSFLGILVTWCPSCSMTIAWMIWLAWVLSGLPFAWLEVKIVGLLIMLWVVYKTLVDLLVCKVK
jgi:hypothetical protein